MTRALLVLLLLLATAAYLEHYIPRRQGECFDCQYGPIRVAS